MYAGAQIRAVREARGMTQAQLGEGLREHLGAPWPRQSVHQAERGGRKLGVDELAAIGAVLDVHPGTFFPSAPDACAVELYDAQATLLGRAVLDLVARLSP